jgi:hypothetical protein
MAKLAQCASRDYPAHASIGFIVDRLSIDLDEGAGGVPCSLAKLGIHVDNSMIWTYV